MRCVHFLFYFFKCNTQLKQQTKTEAGDRFGGQIMKPIAAYYGTTHGMNDDIECLLQAYFFIRSNNTLVSSIKQISVFFFLLVKYRYGLMRAKNNQPQQQEHAKIMPQIE